MKQIIDARVKQSSWTTDPRTPYFPVLCGRVVGRGPEICGGHLGRIWRFTARKDEDPIDRANWLGGIHGFMDWTSIAAPALMDLVVDLRRCHFGESPDGRGYQLWLAEHEDGYRRLPNGDYEVLRCRGSDTRVPPHRAAVRPPRYGH